VIIRSADHWNLEVTMAKKAKKKAKKG